jgi:hypothetical protein
MLTRHATTASAQRASAMRRLRRRASTRLFCATNGCATILAFDSRTGQATCPICGYVRRLD